MHCTEVKKKSVPILPETFANPKKVRATVALHWSQKEYLSSQKRSQIQKRFAQQLHCTEVKKYLSSQKRSQIQKRFAQQFTALKSKRVPILPETFANPKKVRTTVALHWSQKVYLSSQKRSQIQKRFAQQLHCTKVKKSTYPPRNVRKSKKGSQTDNCTALKSKRVPILPETFANPKKVRTTVTLHWSQKEYLSSQKRSQIQKRFAQQLHCTEVKKCTYPPRNVRKSKKGSHNSCTALKSKRVPILPETFANPKKVRATVALHWSQKEYLSSQCCCSSPQYIARTWMLVQCVPAQQYRSQNTTELGWLLANSCCWSYANSGVYKHSEIWE